MTDRAGSNITYLLMNAVADHLERNRENILEEWKRTMEMNEGRFSRLVSLSREKFYNHIPTFLDDMIKHFRGESGWTSEAGSEHGEQRWEYGIDLRLLVKEWSLLHEILIEQLSSCFAEQSFDMQTIESVFKILAQHIHTGVRDSVAKFYRLENRKSIAQLRDLQGVLRRQEKEKKNHTQDLRQTSHDLKGSLLSLKIAVSLLQSRYLEDKKTENIVDNMNQAVESLDRLLNDLLDLFRLEAGRTTVTVSSFDAAAELRDLCKSMRPLAEREGLELHYSGNETLPVKCDRQKVRRIVQNLLLNALKYTDTGSVEVSWEKKGKNQWLITISDTGPGLSYTYASSLTSGSGTDEPPTADDSSAVETTSHDANHGEGIGLLIVRELCQLLNAIIEVETAPGEGTTFRILLPLDLSSDK